MIKLSSVLILLFISACNNHREQSSYRIHEMPLPPVEGTVAIKDELPEQKMNKEHLLQGQKLFNRNCAVCHGLDGSGDSLPVRRGLSRPPALYSQEQIDIYSIITFGQGRMPSYAKKLNERERKMVVAYVEALRLSRRFPLEKLDAKDREKIP